MQELWDLAEREQIHAQRFSRSAVHTTFAPGGQKVTKLHVARFLVSLYPEIAHKQPPVRKPWMGEDARMYLFDALALALVCYADAEKGNGV